MSDHPPAAAASASARDLIAAHGSEVEFRAHHGTGGRPGTLHERSRFEQRAGRWFYLDAAL